MEGVALRYNEGKPDWTLADFKALEPLIDVLYYGWKKYTVKDDAGNIITDGRDNWKKKCDPAVPLQSLLRHAMAISDGELIDPESGKPHIGHVLANAMMFSYHTQKLQDGRRA